MRIRILRSAVEDLRDGRAFYDAQEPGVGDYFYDSLFSDIDSLALYAGIHRQFWGYHRMLSRRFPELASDGSLFIFIFWFSYRGLAPHLHRAHAGHTQDEDGDARGRFNDFARAVLLRSLFQGTPSLRRSTENEGVAKFPMMCYRFPR